MLSVAKEGEPMNWEAFGAVAEALGAAGVIVTLAYLAINMKQNTRALRSASLQAYRTEVSGMMDFSHEHLEVFSKARRGEDLNASERRITTAYAQRLIGIMETVFLNYRNGSVSEEVFEARMAGFRKAMEESSFIRDNWSVWKQYDLTESFIDYVESEILDPDG
jgi:hypothetical protein